MSRIRLVGWLVQPVVMADDGENLTPVQVQPVQIPAAEWEAFKAGGDAVALAQITAQVNGATIDAQPTTRSEHNGRVTKPPRAKATSA